MSCSPAQLELWVDRLDRRHASFETAASRPPQDDGLRSMPSNIRLAEERPIGRVSKRAKSSMQPPPNDAPRLLRLLHLTLVSFQDVVEVRRDRKRLSLAGQI